MFNVKKRIIRYAIIGTGKHAISTFVPAIGESYNSELSCVTSSQTLSKAKAESSALENIPERSVEGILNDHLIDAVYIASPNSTHSEYVSTALKMGKHVLCEKPLVYNFNEIEKIRALDLGTTFLCTGFMYRMHPQFELIRTLLKGTNLISLECSFNYMLDTHLNNIRLSKDYGGGCLLDVGCYLLDVVRYLYPDYRFKYSIKAIINKELGIDSEIEINGGSLDIDHDVKIRLRGSQAKTRFQGLIINTDKYLISTDSPFLVPRNKKVNLVIKHKNGKEKRSEMVAFNIHAAQINLFSESIMKGELLAPLSTGIENAVELTSLWSDIYVRPEIDSSS